MQPLVFISHSAKKPAAAALLAELEQGLKDRDWDVFVDRQRITAGMRWRDQLHTALAVADAAVILFSKEAYEDSEWVLKEATIFGWRRALDPSFRVVPVIFPEVTPPMLSQGRFETIQLGEIQPVKASDANVVAQVHQALGPQKITNPLQRVQDAIAFRFRQIDAATLKLAAEKLGTRLAWSPSLSLHDQFARDLFHADLTLVNAALSDLAVYMSPDDLRIVINLLAPFTANPLAVAPIPRVALAKEAGQRPAVALNSKLEQTGRHYVQRARCHTDQWTVITLTNAGGHDFVGSLSDELLNAFDDGSDPDFSADDIPAELERRQKNGDPVFVLLHGPVETDVLDELRTTFPHCVFVVLAGAQWDESALKNAGVEILLPKVDPVKEEEVRQQIRDARQIAKRRESLGR
jgi:hypothetical protein